MGSRADQNRMYKEQRKQFGLCQRCYRDAYVNPKTGKRQTLCEFHRREQIDRYHATHRDPVVMRRKYRKWNASRGKTPRVHRFLQSLYAELDRLKELDAAGDVKSLLFYRSSDHGTTPARGSSALQDVPADR
jgi:hypothetical protein